MKETNDQGSGTRNPEPTGVDAATRNVAAQWVVRQDRRLTAQEAAELEAWLAADPRHAASFEQAARSWKFFRDLGAAVRRAPEPAVGARPGRGRFFAAGLAAAAAIAWAVVWFERAPRAASAEGLGIAADASAVPITQQLADGSVARLKAGAKIAAAFTPTERRVRLESGEVFFTVTKDPARPFLVEVGPVTVRAVGTAFAVRFEPKIVDVLVTEGAVQVTAPASAAAASPVVGAGHRALVSRALAESATPSITVTPVTREEIARTLAWGEPMLELAGATLRELVAEITRRSGQQIEIGDAGLEAVRIGGRFPVHDIEGFTRALEAVYEVKAQRRDDGTIVLRAR